MSVWCIRRLRWTLNMWLWLRIHHKANHTAVKKNLCAGDKSVKTIFTCQNQPCTAEPLAMFFFLLFSQNKNVQIVFKDRESSVGLAAIWQEWQWINGCTVQFCIHTCLNASLHTYTPLKSSAHRYANRIIVKRKKKHVPFWQQQLTFKKQTIKYETNTCRKHFPFWISTEWYSPWQSLVSPNGYK